MDIAPTKRERKSYQRICTHFRTYWLPVIEAELDAFRCQDTFAAAVWNASFGRVPWPDGTRKHDHMRRRGDATLGACVVALMGRLPDLEAHRGGTFDGEKGLHATVERLIGGIHDVAELTVYDMARWIGAYLRLEPELIYLHTGTRHGAAALGIEVSSSEKTLDKYRLPSEFWTLSCGYLEDLMCLYKEPLARAQAGEKVRMADLDAYLPERRRGCVFPAAA